MILANGRQKQRVVRVGIRPKKKLDDNIDERSCLFYCMYLLTFPKTNKYNLQLELLLGEKEPRHKTMMMI